jgi:small-conductance mechanosensitive channel
MEHLWEDIRRVLEYPLIRIGPSPLTLATLATFILAVVLVFMLEHLLRRYLLTRVLHLQPSLQYAVSRITGYLFLAIGFYVALRIVNIDLSSLAIVAGAVGVGLGFGLQNIISNFVSGLIILAERPIAIGDHVEVDNVDGQVTRISLRSTTIVTSDNISVIVPNSNFITNTVINWSHGDPKVQIRVPLGVAYGTDTEKLRRVLLEVAAAHPKVLSDPAPTVFFVAFGDNSMNFELGVWTAEMAGAPRRFRSEINFAIERVLRENKIEIPYPQRDLRLRAGSVLIRETPSGKTVELRDD